MYVSLMVDFKKKVIYMYMYLYERTIVEYIYLHDFIKLTIQGIVLSTKSPNIICINCNIFFIYKNHLINRCKLKILLNTIRI